MFEKANSLPSDVYQVTVDGVRETFAFLETNVPESKHAEIAQEISKSSPDLLGGFIGLVESWHLAEAAQSDITNGFLTSYKLLKIQATLEGSSLPTVQNTVIDTYLVDIAQSGGVDTGHYFSARFDELALDDPVFTSFLGTCDSAMGESANQDSDGLPYFCVGAILLHDMLYKQAASNQMHRQFKM